MREIVLDTETTGLDPKSGDRVVEIGGVELLNHIPTGRSLHLYINPERDMPAEAFAVHGLSVEFLSKYPVFADIASEFVEFVDGAKLIIHNAPFDMGFLNHELEVLGRRPIPYDMAVDTLLLARRRNPGGPNNLDALCARYGIDNSRRDKHGALLDAELLAEVYIELIGGRQAALSLMETEVRSGGAGIAHTIAARPEPLPPRISDTERKAHSTFVATLGADAIWRKYRDVAEDQPED